MTEYPGCPLGFLRTLRRSEILICAFDLLAPCTNSGSTTQFLVLIGIMLGCNAKQARSDPKPENQTRDYVKFGTWRGILEGAQPRRQRCQGRDTARSRLSSR